MSCPQIALFSASQRCMHQRQAGAQLAGEGGAWAASDVAPDQRTRLVTMRLREGRGSTHLALLVPAEEWDDEVSDRPSKRRGWRQGENEWTLALSLAPGSSAYSAVRSSSREKNDTLSVWLYSYLCRYTQYLYQRGTLTNSARVPRFSSLPKRSESGRHEKAARGGQARYLSPAV